MVNNTIDAAVFIRHKGGIILALDGPPAVALQGPGNMGKTAARDFAHDVVTHQGPVCKEVLHFCTSQSSDLKPGNPEIGSR